MVSVIVVTSNRSKLLAKCLYSIINQTYSNIEIIVVDDGSIDNTQHVINSINDKRIVYIREMKTGNVSLMRNIGIKISKGEIIAFCDDDDMWMENKLEILLEYLQTEKIVCSNAKVIDKDDKVLFEQISKYENDRYIDLYQLLQDNRIQTSCVVLYKGVLFEIGLFDEINGNRSEDWCVWIKIAEKYNIKYVNKSLVSYRIHDNNLSMKSFLDVEELAIRNIEILSPFLENSDKKIIESAKFGMCLVYSKLIWLYYENDYLQNSFDYCKKYLSAYPQKISLKYFKYSLFFINLGFRKLIKSKQ